MKLLFLAPQVPWPANKGDRQRSYALLRALARRHEVTLSVPATPDEEQACREGLKGVVADFMPVPPSFGVHARSSSGGGPLRRMGRLALDLVSEPTPFAFRLATDKYPRLIARKRHAFDAVFCRYLYTWPIARAFPRENVIVDVDDLHYLGLRRAALGPDARRNALWALAESARSYCYEQAIYREIGQALVCSDADLARIRSRRKSVVRNGVDLPDSTRLRPVPDPHTVIFVGQMGYRPNVEGLRWFIDEVWPSVRERVADARLIVAGREATSKTVPFADAPGVELVGEVAETASWISSAVLSIAPLRVGMGTRIKIIESLACGRPVVATHVGAEGLTDIDERMGLFRTDEPGAMAASIVSLLKDSERALVLGARGRAFVESHLTWDAVTRHLADSIKEWIPTRDRATQDRYVMADHR